MDPLIQILKRLKEQGLDFVVIGGMAAVAHGSTLVTRDVDISAPLDDASLQKIVDALSGLNPRWRFRPDKVIPVDSVEGSRGCKHLYITTDWGSLDILSEVAGVGMFEQVRARGIDMDLGDLSCPVLDIDALIAAKRAAGRKKDVAAARQLEAIKKARGL